jgi:hypothetical protein
VEFFDDFSFDFWLPAAEVLRLTEDFLFVFRKEIMTVMSSMHPSFLFHASTDYSSNASAAALASSVW